MTTGTTIGVERKLRAASPRVYWWQVIGEAKERERDIADGIADMFQPGVQFSTVGG